MNDEANTHYFAMLDQLIEGHQFIENKLGWKNIVFLFSLYPPILFFRKYYSAK
jgi:hypothetical protein